MDNKKTDFFSGKRKKAKYIQYFCTLNFKRMASFLKLYESIEYKLKDSAIQLNDIQQEIKKLREENQHLKQQLLKAREEKQKILTQSLLVQENASQQEKKDNNDIKKEIQEIVREIDNCIGIMKGI